MSGGMDLIEVQGSAEGKPFSRQEFNQLIDLAETGIKSLIKAQKSVTA